MVKEKNKIVCFGEPLIRLQAVDNPFFSQDQPINIYPGGSEANTAVRLASLGMEISFVSAGPENRLTQDYLDVLEKKNVGTADFIIKGDRLGVFYLLSHDGLTKGEVIYDRKYSSFYHLEKGDVDWERVFDGCDFFHWTALTPALSLNLVELLTEGLKYASEKNITISVDLNYRSKLWDYGKDPNEIMPELVKHCDLILGNIWAAHIMLDTPLNREIDIDTPSAEVLNCATEVSEAIFEQFPKAKLVANTFRFMENPNHNRLYGTAHTPDKNVISSIKETEAIVDRIGSGDAFMAGIIAGYKTGAELQDIIELGIREGYAKLFVEGDF